MGEGSGGGESFDIRVRVQPAFYVELMFSTSVDAGNGVQLKGNKYCRVASRSSLFVFFSFSFSYSSRFRALFRSRCDDDDDDDDFGQRLH